ncbi:MAG TPA: cobalt ABC transporter ATP-binding protein [Verrucomicrobia bacterium]|nr:cobalt ABC transporter ATP-binding protein [Verrucomicrobiota bacterium]
MNDWILEADALSYRYPCGKMALDSLDLKVARGRRLVVLGANGAGKTTLFMCLNGLLSPQSGGVRINGRIPGSSRSDRREWRRQVGLVFQNPDDQVAAGNVLQDVAFGPLNLGMSPEAARQRARESLDILAIGSMAETPTHELSFGMRKLVAIAGVLSMRPEIIVLDEPTAGIDPEGARQVHQALDSVQAQGTTLIISTHDMDMAYEWADEAAILSGGRTLRQGPVSEIFADTALLQHVRLQSPWLLDITRQLQSAGVLPAGGAPCRTRQQLTARLSGVHGSG